MANSVFKNAEKGGVGAIIVIVATGIAEVAVVVGMPEQFKPLVVTVVSGGIMWGINWFKHRKDK